MKRFYTALVATILAFTSVALYAEVNTLYFMNYLPYKIYMNPAFQSNCDTYVELPIISTIGVDVNAGALSVSDIIKNSNGKMVTFLHPDFGTTERDALFKKLHNNNIIKEELNVSLFGFGFKLRKRGYLSINMSLREDLTAFLPKDLFSFLLYGTPDSLGNHYDFTNTKVSANAYIDFNGGYSYRINDKWSVGGRLHLLLGLANASASFNSLTLDAQADKWRLTGNGVANISFPGISVKTDAQGKIEGFNFPSQFNEYVKNYKPCMGAALDLGGVYRPIKNLNISLSLKDMGFMIWDNSGVANANVDYTYTGLEYSPSDKNVNYGDSLLKALESSYYYNAMASGQPYVSAMNAKMYVGVEYSFLKDMMSVGLLSRTELNAGRLSEELTLSYNLRPCYWFSMSASYSFISGGFNTIGLGLNLRLPPFNFYVVSDYMPLYYSAEGIPYRSQRLNLQAGILLTFNCAKSTPLHNVAAF